MVDFRLAARVQRPRGEYWHRGERLDGLVAPPPRSHPPSGSFMAWPRGELRNSSTVDPAGTEALVSLAERLEATVRVRERTAAALVAVGAGRGSPAAVKHRFRERLAWPACWGRAGRRGNARSRLGAMGNLRVKEGDEALFSIVLGIELATALVS